MNQQLYQQFLYAAMVLVNIGKYNERIYEHQERIQEQRAIMEAEERKARQASRRRPRWIPLSIISGIIFLSVFLGGFVSVVEDAYIDDPSTVIALLILSMVFGFVFFLCAVVGPTISIIRRQKAMKKAKNELACVSTDINKVISQINNDIREVEKARNEYARENSHYFNFLPAHYHNESAIAFMLQALENMRADTLKEVINLYEYELHLRRQEQILEDHAYAQRLHNEQMEYLMASINRSQENMRSDMQFMAAMQAIDILTR